MTAAPVRTVDMNAPPSAWYYVAPSHAVRSDRVTSLSLAGSPVVAFRNRAGSAVVLDAYCPHLGAHLGHADLIDGTIRCALHHRRFDERGAPCEGIGGAAEAIGSVRSHVAHDWSGALFAYRGDATATAHPTADTAAMHRGRGVEVGCSWRAIAANAFDVAHLGVVHHRELIEPAVVSRPASGRFVLRYRSRPVGSSVADHVLRRVAPDGIGVTIECVDGSAIRVESAAGPYRSRLHLALAPRGKRTLVVPFVDARGAIMRRVALRLYSAFLRRDVEVLEGMRFAPRLALPHDAALAEFLNYLDSLPRPARADRGEELG
jgi:nitrite reductase/ring-hydroxylating ferredoxin subunit